MFGAQYFDVAAKKQSMKSIFSTTHDRRRCDEISGDEIYGHIFGICACVVLYKGHNIDARDIYAEKYGISLHLSFAIIVSMLIRMLFSPCLLCYLITLYLIYHQQHQIIQPSYMFIYQHPGRIGAKLHTATLE